MLNERVNHLVKLCITELDAARLHAVVPLLGIKSTHSGGFYLMVCFPLIVCSPKLINDDFDTKFVVRNLKEQRPFLFYVRVGERMATENPLINYVSVSKRICLITYRTNLQNLYIYIIIVNAYL